MIDPEREVTLVAGDTSYTLYAGNRALRLIEREVGKPLPDILEGMESGSVGLVTTVLWALLQQHHPGTSIDDVDEIIDSGEYDVIGEAIGEAASRAFRTGTGGDDAGKATALTGARPGTGNPSSPARSRRG